MNITSENAALYAAIAAEITKQVEALQSVEPQTPAKIWPFCVAIAKEQQMQPAKIWPFCVEDLPLAETYWIGDTGEISQTPIYEYHSPAEMPTHAAAESALAFMQLSRIIYYLNDGEMFVANGEAGYTVCAHKGLLSKNTIYFVQGSPRILIFKNEADRDRSMIDHRELWEKYCMI